jgi:hypothetical protein
MNGPTDKANKQAKVSNMFKTTDELKTFILWAKKEGLKRVKVGEVEFELSDLTLAAAMSNVQPSDGPTRDASTGSIPDITDDELLYMSAR